MGTPKLTPTMRAELRNIDRHGTFRELDDYGMTALAFYARDRVLGALLKRGLIVPTVDGYETTEAGRAALWE